MSYYFSYALDHSVHANNGIGFFQTHFITRKHSSRMRTDRLQSQAGGVVAGVTYMSRCIVNPPCLRLTFVYSSWLPSPTRLGNHASVLFVCAVRTCGADNVGSNVRNDIAGPVTQNVSLLRDGMTSQILYKARSVRGNCSLATLCQMNRQP